MFYTMPIVRELRLGEWILLAPRYPQMDRSSPHNCHHNFALDLDILNVHTVCMVIGNQTVYSTGEVAKAIGVDKKTLLRWLAGGELPEPKTTTIGQIEYRIWSEKDLARAKQYREANYRQKRTRK